MNTKRCRRCGKAKEGKEFYANLRAKDGLTSYCMACTGQYGKEYKQKRKIERERLVLKTPMKDIVRQQNARARKRGLQGFVTLEEWQEICRRQGGRCNECGREVALTMDHIIALADGGEHEASNIQGVCLSCNCRKASKDTQFGRVRQW